MCYISRNSYSADLILSSSHPTRWLSLHAPSHCQSIDDPSQLKDEVRTTIKENENARTGGLVFFTSRPYSFLFQCSLVVARPVISSICAICFSIVRSTAAWKRRLCSNKAASFWQQKQPHEGKEGQWNRNRIWEHHYNARAHSLTCVYVDCFSPPVRLIHSSSRHGRNNYPPTCWSGIRCGWTPHWYRHSLDLSILHSPDQLKLTVTILE